MLHLGLDSHLYCTLGAGNLAGGRLDNRPRAGNLLEGSRPEGNLLGGSPQEAVGRLQVAGRSPVVVDHTVLKFYDYFLNHLVPSKLKKYLQMYAKNVTYLLVPTFLI